MRTSRVPNSPIMQRLTVSIRETQLDQNTTVSSKPQIGVSQRPRSPTHWRNPPAAKTLTVRIPPVAGTISTPIGLLQSENLHPLEELIRWYTSQHPDSPTHWRNLPAHTPPNCPDSSSEWRDPDTSSRTVSTAAIVWTRRHAGWRAWRTPSPLQGTQTPSARPIGWQSRIRRP